MTGLKSQTYEERLVELKLPSLRERRHEMDMVQTYKLLNSESGENIFERADIRRETRATAGTDNLLPRVQEQLLQYESDWRLEQSPK